VLQFKCISVSFVISASRASQDYDVTRKTYHMCPQNFVSTGSLLKINISKYHILRFYSLRRLSRKFPITTSLMNVQRQKATTENSAFGSSICQIIYKNEFTFSSPFYINKSYPYEIEKNGSGFWDTNTCRSWKPVIC
jgi:hypothetical protein